MSRVRLPARDIVRALNRIGRREAHRGAVHVIVVDDPHMHALNRRFRRRDRPTDVLAFPLADGMGAIDGGPWGEIYCNYDHARRWRSEHGGTVAAELIRLAVHGYLHLLGYDHHTVGQRRRMIAAENRCLAAAGLVDLRGRRVSAQPSRRGGRAGRD
ncbi:MAG: rRNA maturation RNase YbeY [Candidatus Zixiibacteriota bacterium]